MIFENGHNIQESSKILKYYIFDYNDESYECAINKYFSEMQNSCPISNYLQFNNNLHDGRISNWFLVNDKLSYVLSVFGKQEIKLQFTYEGLKKFKIYRLNKNGYPVKCSKALKPKEFLYDEISMTNNKLIEHAIIFDIGKNRRGNLLWIFHAEEIRIENI